MRRQSGARTSRSMGLQISVPMRIKYHKALVAIELAYGLVKNIGCAGPFMSL